MRLASLENIISLIIETNVKAVVSYHAGLYHWLIEQRTLVNDKYFRSKPVCQRHVILLVRVESAPEVLPRLQVLFISPPAYRAND